VKRIRENLTYANVMSTIAVLLVIGGGTAIASGLGRNVVHSRNIAPKAVKTTDIAKGAVSESRLANDAVSSGKLKDNAVTASKLADGSVDSRQIAPNAVEEAKLAPDLRGKLNAVQAGGIVRVDAAGTSVADAPERTLITRGPFRVYGKCWAQGGNVAAQTFIATSAPGTLATGATVAFRGGTNSPYLDPSTAEASRRISSVSSASAFAAGFAGAATMINGSNAISFAVNGWVKGATVVADSSNYGAGAARCLFSPSLVAASG